MMCKAYRSADQLFCPSCAFAWDVTDPEPPKCNHNPRPASHHDGVRLIGLVGGAGSGKSTVATHLMSTQRWHRVKMADPLKQMFRRLLQVSDLPDDEIEAMIEGDLKEVPHPAINFKTPRHAMQTLGTEWGRVQMGGDFWVKTAERRISNAFSTGVKGVVVDDVRFANEADVIKRQGGMIVCLTGRGGIAGGHASELAEGITPDVTIDNGRHTSLSQLFDEINRLL